MFLTMKLKFLTVKLKFHQKKLHETFFNSMRKTYLGSFTSLAPPKASSRELHLLSSIPRPHLGRLRLFSSTSSLISAAPPKALSRETPPPQLHPKASSRETSSHSSIPMPHLGRLHLLSSTPRPHLWRLHPSAPSQSLISGNSIPQLHPKASSRKTPPPLPHPKDSSRKTSRFSLENYMFLTGKQVVSHW